MRQLLLVLVLVVVTGCTCVSFPIPIHEVAEDKCDPPSNYSEDIPYVILCL